MAFVVPANPAKLMEAEPLGEVTGDCLVSELQHEQPLTCDDLCPGDYQLNF